MALGSVGLGSLAFDIVFISLSQLRLGGPFLGLRGCLQRRLLLIPAGTLSLALAEHHVLHLGQAGHKLLHVGERRHPRRQVIGGHDSIGAAETNSEKALAEKSCSMKSHRCFHCKSRMSEPVQTIFMHANANPHSTCTADWNKHSLLDIFSDERRSVDLARQAPGSPLL